MDRDEFDRFDKFDHRFVKQAGYAGCLTFIMAVTMWLLMVAIFGGVIALVLHLFGVL